MRLGRAAVLGGLLVVVIAAVAVGALVVRGHSSQGQTSALGPPVRIAGASQGALQPVSVPSINGLNYGEPATVDGRFVGTEWLRSGTGAGDHWSETQPALASDLAFLRQHNLGHVQRILLGLDQTMRWDGTNGFVGFYEPTLQNFQQALDMFQAHDMKVIVVLYD